MTTAAEQNKAPKAISFWASAWRRFSRNKMAVVGGVFAVILILTAVLAPLVAPYQYDETDSSHAFESSSWKHPFGTDDLGRDMLSRLIYSIRNALFIGLGAQFVVLVIGVILGAIAGFRGGRMDAFLMRVVDVMYAFPTFLFNVILIAVMGRGLFTIFIAIGLTSWAGIARLVRGQILVLRETEFVEAARAIGAGDGHIIRKYLLPNTVGPIIVSLAFGIPGAIWMESGLALIGMGVQPPMPSWGNLMGAGMGMVLGYPHLLIWPALTFGLTLLAFTWLGDGLQDALNPKSEV
jgi:ABC-type dipeptide/oligopeptide/nickel transport system permease subunit